MRRLSNVGIACLAAALLAVPHLAAAASPVQTTFQVKADVLKACTVSATDITVASYDPNNAAPTTATGTVSIACTKGTTYTTTLASGNGWKLNGPGGVSLAYKIFQGSGSTLWDATTAYPGSAPSKAPVPYTATASIDAAQDVPAGSYTDTVTVSVNY